MTETAPRWAVAQNATDGVTVGDIWNTSTDFDFETEQAALDYIHELQDEPDMNGWYATIAQDARYVETIVSPAEEECSYCHHMTPWEDNYHDVPHEFDDDEWERLATLHSPDCEWILTRAHTRKEA